MLTPPCNLLPIIRTSPAIAVCFWDGGGGNGGEGQSIWLLRCRPS